MVIEIPALIQRVPKAHHVVFRDIVSAKDDKTLHDVAQFADVAGPLVLFQGFQCFRLESGDGFSHVLSDDFQEIADQQRDIVLAFAQRRHIDHNDTETVV